MNPDQLNLEVANSDLKLVSEYKPYIPKPVSERSVHSENFDKYSYVKANPFWIKLTYLFGIITWLISLYGYAIFFNLNWIYWVAFGPFLVASTMYYLVNYGINLMYKKFDLHNHLKVVEKFKLTPNKPSVDILLPICGESISILERTWYHVSKLDYPNFKVHILDDKDDNKAELLAKQYGFNYLSRPNKGEMKKAGNLKFGFQNSDNKYIVIFDADFAPIPEFLNETVPYLELDEKIGILQTPQHFEVHKSIHDRSWLEYGAAANQEGFYKIIQPSRNEVGGAICVGTNAVYRRTALEKIGGTAQIEHSEDVWTGVLLLNKGYKVVFKAIILAEGFCPESHTSFFTQQYRWCKGSMSLMTNKLFWKAPIPFKTKITYISGFLYYITSLFSYYMPFLIFVVLWNHFDKINIQNTIPFLPYIFFSFVIIPLTRSYYPRTGIAISRFAAFASYAMALVHTIFGINMAWVPTGSSVKRKNFWFSITLLLNLLFSIIYISITIIFYMLGKLPLNNYNYWVLEFWIVLNVFYTGTYLINSGHDVFFKNA